ncbi:two pore potassium channel protein sup-9-like [Montipora capricornis]|uniref:two pore potassium channel protein sup-9-like n=1 Tax=Montipora capricornis TaxID=246305 RepID=UPI0035F13834
MDPLLKTALLRMLVFLIFAGVVPWLFVLVEDSNEDTIEAKYHLLRSLYRFMTSKYNMTMEDFKNFSSMAYDALSDTRPSWTYGAGLSCVLQAITTIGYGSVTPRTSAGQLLCIVVALVGIPLTLLLLKSIGDSIVKIVNNAIAKFERKILHTPVPKNLQTKSAVTVFFVLNFLMIINGLILMYLEDWTFVKGMYFWFIAYTTIGFGDYLPLPPRARKVNIHKALYFKSTLDEDMTEEVSPAAGFIYIVFLVLHLCLASSVVNSIVVAIEEWKHRSKYRGCVPRKLQARSNREQNNTSTQGETNVAYAITLRLGFQEKTSQDISELASIQ